MTITDIDTFTVQLGTGEVPEPQRLFGELVKIAAPIIERYHSDLYHDATWLSHNLTDTRQFYYGVDNYGTTIGIDSVILYYRKTRQFKITITRERRNWFAEVKRLN